MKVLSLTLAFLIFPLLFGCAVNDTNEARNDDGKNNIRDVQFDPNETRDEINGNNDRNDNNRLEVADKAVDRITELDEVESANIIVTNRNAYTAVVLRDGAKDEVTDQLENKIADQVKATDPDIQNVYVSSNPDFVKRMTDYGERIGEGDPIEGFFEEFNEMARRVFPNAR